MMTRAYQEMFLRKAMINIGDMFDFAINGIGIPDEDFASIFAHSQTAARLEIGEPKYLVGMCGEELAIRVLEETTGLVFDGEPGENFSRTPDHWCGRSLAYYQWLRAVPYKRIFEAASYNEISAMYPMLHEADVSKFADVMDEAFRIRAGETNLKRIRTAFGYSQSELAASSGVSLRSIQMYEQRQKDINKGQSATILSLARTLGCGMEALMEI